MPPPCATLTREAYAKWVPVIGREPLPMRADYDEAVRQHRIDLAFLDGGLAALIETIDKGDHLVIENVAVAPAFQGHGLGRHLLTHAEQLAAELGYAEVRLYTNKMFEANVAALSRLRLPHRPRGDLGARRHGLYEQAAANRARNLTAAA